MTEKTWQFESAVEFGGVSVGEETASIGIKLSRGGIELAEADELLCGRRLEVELSRNGSEQKQLPNMEGVGSVVSTCDSKRFGATPKDVTVRFQFNLNELDVKELATLAKRAGSLKLNHIGDLAAEPEPENEPADGQGTML